MPAPAAATNRMDPQPLNTLRTYLDFETPIRELEGKVAELKTINAGDNNVSIADEIKKLEQKTETALVDIYSKLTPWQKTLVAAQARRLLPSTSA